MSMRSRLGIVAAALVGLVLSHPVAGAQTGVVSTLVLVGSWRVVSYELEFQDGSERRYPLGRNPNGYLVFGSDGRMMAYLEADGRQAPRTDVERSTAYQTLIAYTGRYHVEGDKWITAVDGAWNIQWVGTNQERSFTVRGKELSVLAQWNSNPLFDGKITRGHLIFVREGEAPIELPI